MSKSRKDPEVVATYADHEVIVPPNKLKKAMVKVSSAEPDEDPLAQAEQALANLSSEFAEWMETECVRLDAARNAAKTARLAGQAREELFRAAHDIKGQAATFGYPSVAPVAESLCRLLEFAPDPTRIPVALIDQHVDAVRAIVRENARGDDRTAATLGARLRNVTDEFLLSENKHRPDMLELIAAPSLAPGG